MENLMTLKSLLNFTINLQPNYNTKKIYMNDTEKKIIILETLTEGTKKALLEEKKTI
jgi:hypothetical protein